MVACAAARAALDAPRAWRRMRPPLQLSWSPGHGLGQHPVAAKHNEVAATDADADATAGAVGQAEARVVAAGAEVDRLTAAACATVREQSLDFCCIEAMAQHHSLTGVCVCVCVCVCM